MPVALSVMRAFFNLTQGDIMINLLAMFFIACGEDEKEDTAPASELVSEEEAMEKGSEPAEEVVEEEEETTE
tara:strand:+ start:478 stop:693 length:216 start_codon:yes stop_codon:yes gene_type:complete